MSRPGTVRAVAQAEIQRVLRDGRFRVLAGAIALLLVVAVIVSWNASLRARADRTAAAEAERRVWLDQGEKNPHSAAHFGRFALRPEPALAAFDRGIHDHVGRAVWLEAHWQDPFELRPAEDRTAIHRFAELTPAWILQVIVPLMIVMMAFGAVAGERERGTLRMLMSVGVDGRRLLAGKALGLAGALALVLVPVALIMGVLLLLPGGPGTEQGGSVDGGRLWGGALVLSVVHAAYLAVFLVLSLAVSARSRSARAALLSLLAVWLMMTLILPRWAADLAERAAPTPSAQAFYAAVAKDQAEGVDGHGDRDTRRAALEAATLAEYGAESLESLPVNFAGISLQASEEHANLVFDKHFGTLWSTYERQETLHRWVSLLSPTVALRLVSMATAGTNLEQVRHFADAAEQHRRVLVKFLNDDMRDHAGEASFGYLADEALWAEAPNFDYTPPSFAAGLRGEGFSLLVLGGWLVLALALAGRAARALSPV